MADETATKAQAKTGAKGEVAPDAKTLGDGLPAVITLSSMKEAFPEDGEEAFYQIGIAGGFGDFRRHGDHANPALELLSLTGTHRKAVAEIYAGAKK